MPSFNNCSSTDSMMISVGARSSPLSRVQVQEILEELHQYYPSIFFEVSYVMTYGDKDRQTSLRDLERTDFFTREVDEMVLDGRCRIGIHSAKDLPIPLSDGLVVVCLTNGIDPSDSLVLRPGESVDLLPAGAKIATSSLRREEMVRQLRVDLQFCDIRGTIAERLAILERDEVDGVVIAEAALIRLGLTHLNRIKLPGETVEGQGKLAVVARIEDGEMRQLFAPLDSRLSRLNYNH